MNFEKYLEKKKKIYQKILDFFDNEGESDENFNELDKIFIDQAIKENKEELLATLQLLSSITNNHYRQSNFFTKAEQILNNLKSEIQQFFTNMEIFNIFKRNKRILLFLLENKMMKLDESIAFIISKGWYKKTKYPFYFHNFALQLLDLLNNLLSIKTFLCINRKKIEFNIILALLH